MSLALALVLLLQPADGPNVGVIWARAGVPSEGAPQAQPGAEAGAELQASVAGDDPLRARVMAEIGRNAGVGARVVDDADRAARTAIAFEVGRTQVDAQRARMSRLEAGEAAIRGGDPQAALSATNEVLAEARADPTAPGLVALLVRAHLLRAQVARTEGDPAGADEALRSALRLDPHARVSTRRLPPDLVERHEALAAEILADRTAWDAIEIEAPADATVEIDGRVGLREVPSGEHLVVVRRPGAAPVGAWVERSWTAPEPGDVLEPGLPSQAADAERVCTALDLERLVLVRRRGTRVGVQEYRCGRGFTTTAFAGVEAPEVAIAEVRAAPVSADPIASAALGDDGRWPVPDIAPRRDPGIDDPGPQTRPWWRRGWVWGVIATVVVGGVVTGAVVGTRDDPSGYVVDGSSFIDR